MSVLSSTFNMFWMVFKWPFIVLGAIFVLFLILITINIFILKLSGKYEQKVGQHFKVKRISFFKRIFFDAPKQFAKDYLRKDPEHFGYQGCIVYTGRQGSGKTISLVHDSMKMQLEYPRAVVLSNLGYKYCTEELKHWKQLVDYQNPNGIDKGIIVQIDEEQNWFNSKQSINFPPEMLSVITQERKNRRIILGTAQNFYMLAKDIRSQTTEVRSCFTIAKVITIVHRQIPIINADGEVEKMKHKGFYFFVQNDEIRSAYDTWKVIDSLAKSGFSPRQKDADFKVNVELPKKHGLLKH